MGTAVRKPYFIGLGHRKQQGKDTAAAYLAGHLRDAWGTGSVVFASFAGPLKELCRHIFGLTAAQTDGSESEKNTPTQIRHWDREVETINPAEPFTARALLQHFGTDVRRMWPTAWAGAPFRREYPEEVKFVIITDVRFTNEAEMVHIFGGHLCKIVRNVAEEKDTYLGQHISETELTNYGKWDSRIENIGTLGELKASMGLLAATMVPV